MNAPLHAQAVFQALQVALKLDWIGGQAGAKHIVLEKEALGETLSGRLNWVHAPKLQILGQEEFHFLKTLDETIYSALIQRLLSPPTKAILICGDPTWAETLRSASDVASIPLWYTPFTPVTTLAQLSKYQQSVENSTLLHGELLEVFGLGVLITGHSGIGKSELALELISRGHRLIADDTPKLCRVAPNVIEGTCPPTLRDFLEVRGLGILNIRRMFGDSAIKRNKRVRLLIDLVRLEDTPIPAELRLHGARATQRILNVAIAAIALPIAPGRNLAVLVECAVRDHIQRLSGYHAEQDLAERLQNEMAGTTVCE
jgi:HPr kinase/phosphorylase